MAPMFEKYRYRRAPTASQAEGGCAESAGLDSQEILGWTQFLRAALCPSFGVLALAR